MVRNTKEGKSCEWINRISAKCGIPLRSFTTENTEILRRRKVLFHADFKKI